MIAAVLVQGFVSGARSAEIRMIAPVIPPHFHEDGSGRIGDVIRASLERCDHTVHFTTVPFGRHWLEYKQSEKFDALATAEADQVFSGYTTEPFMHLQDGATLLASDRSSTVVSVSDLHGLRVVAFPNADKILGIEADVKKFASFRTRSQRFDQIRPLFASRADAVLADGLITATFIEKLRERAASGREPNIDPALKTEFRRIFKPGPQRLYFRNESVARDFDRCFAELRDNGEVERIAAPYVDKFRKVLGDQYPVY